MECAVTNASESSPVDDEHTNRSHVGEAISDGRNYPGYLLIGLGLATLGLTLVAAGYGFRGWAVIAGVVCVVSFIVGKRKVSFIKNDAPSVSGRLSSGPCLHQFVF